MTVRSSCSRSADLSNEAVYHGRTASTCADSSRASLAGADAQAIKSPDFCSTSQRVACAKTEQNRGRVLTGPSIYSEIPSIYCLLIRATEALPPKAVRNAHVNGLRRALRAS